VGRASEPESESDPEIELCWKWIPPEPHAATASARAAVVSRPAILPTTLTTAGIKPGRRAPLAVGPKVVTEINDGRAT
jgi:hypothetical protein